MAPCARPYLDALLPKDANLEPQEMSESSQMSDRSKSQTAGQSSEGGDSELIDNPYLRPVKPPRYRKKQK